MISAAFLDHAPKNKSIKMKQATPVVYRYKNIDESISSLKYPMPSLYLTETYKDDSYGQSNLPAFGSSNNDKDGISSYLFMVHPTMTRMTFLYLLAFSYLTSLSRECEKNSAKKVVSTEGDKNQMRPLRCNYFNISLVPTAGKRDKLLATRSGLRSYNRKESLHQTTNV